jgi:hypothetical protein
MKKSTKRLLGGLAFAAGAVGAARTLVKKKGKTMAKPTRAPDKARGSWARPGMQVTFRAELMPGRDREQRTAQVKKVLPSGRVLLHEIDGEHAEKEFEAIV